MIKVDNLVNLEEEIQKRKEASFQKLLEDKDIALFQKQHQLSNKEMMIYWSDLLSYADDKKICEHCLGLETCPKVIKGMRLKLAYDGSIKTTFSYCIYGEALKEKNMIFQMIQFNNIVGDLEDYSFVKVSKEYQKLHKDIFNKVIMPLLHYVQVPNEKGYFISWPEEDKTKVMISFMNELALQNYKRIQDIENSDMKDYHVGICKVSQFISEIKQSFGNSNSEVDIKKIAQIPYLLLEGLGEENITSWSRDEILIPLLEYRLLNHLPTFISSYYSIDTLKEAYQLNNDVYNSMKAKKLANLVKNLTKEIRV